MGADAPLPVLTSPRTVSDQLAVPDVLVKVCLAQAQPTPGLAEAPATVPLCGQRSVHSLPIPCRQPDPAGIERRLLFSLEEPAPAPTSDRRPSDAHLGGEHAHRDQAIAPRSIPVRDDGAGGRDPVATTHLAHPCIGPR